MYRESEKWFASYLQTHNYSATFEPELFGFSKPDFLISKFDKKALCEVKEFETHGIFTNFDFDLSVTRSRPLKEALKPIRNQISAAAGQLKEHQGLGFPLIVVLANPLRAQVTLNDSLIISAMFGDLSTVFSIDEKGKTKSLDYVGRNGALTNNHKYISGIVHLEQVSRNQETLKALITNATSENPEMNSLELMKLLEDFELNLNEDEISFKCTVFENSSDLCIPIPVTWFNGLQDRRYMAENGVMRLVNSNDLAD